MSMKITAHTTKAPPMSQNMLIVRSQTMLRSDHKLSSRQITDYAHVRTQTMLTGIRSRSSESEKPTLCRGPVVSAPTVKTTELMFSVNSTSTAGSCGQIFFILTQIPMHVIKYYSKQTPIHIIKCDLKNDNRI